MYTRRWPRRSLSPWGWYCGPVRGVHTGLSREERIRLLEEHQRDLEQRAANTADLISWLRAREGDRAPAATAPSEEEPPS